MIERKEGRKRARRKVENEETWQELGKRGEEIQRKRKNNLGTPSLMMKIVFTVGVLVLAMFFCGSQAADLICRPRGKFLCVCVCVLFLAFNRHQVAF